MNSTFRQRVFAIVRSIKPGTTLSYKDVAQLAGSPKAYRAVGTLLKHNYDPDIPCHRVIKSDGSLGGYNRGQNHKKMLLELESS